MGNLKILIQMNKNYTASGTNTSYGLIINNQPVAEISEEDLAEMLYLIKDFEKILRQSKLSEFGSEKK